MQCYCANLSSNNKQQTWETNARPLRFDTPSSPSSSTTVYGHGMAWQEVGVSIQEARASICAHSPVLSVLDCLYLPLWPHCLWPCRCITGPLPCSLPFLFPLYLPSISDVFVYMISPYVHVPLVRCPSQCSILAGRHGICRKSQKSRRSG